MNNNPQNIYEMTRQEYRGFIDDYINIVDGWEFNQYQTIKKIHLYYNSKYVSGDVDSAGRKKIFFNVVKPPCKVASRFLNFDTKDVRLIANNPDSEIATMLLGQELKYWMKTNSIDAIMNKIATEAPIYGTVILRKTKHGAKVQDLRYVAMDQTVENIKDSRFVIIEHHLTPTQMRNKIKDGWDKDAVEDAIRNFYTNRAPDSYVNSRGMNQVVSTPYIKVKERFGEVPASWLTNKPNNDDNQVMERSIFIVVGDDSFVTGEDKQTVVGENGITLFKSKWNGDWPFKDFHYDKTPGRYLGIGVVEDLFPVQERVNELTNQKRSSMQISSMHIFQTQDKTVVKNILRDLSDGAVITAGIKGGLTPLANEERNLPAFNSEEQRFAKQVNDLTFAYDATRGEALPSTTPATNAVIQERSSASVYMFKRENLGNMYRAFFNDDVIPDAIKQLSYEHMMHFIGGPEELAKLDNLLVSNIAKQRGIEIMLSGKYADPEKIKADILTELKKFGSSRFINIKKEFYKNADIDFDINVQNEQENSPMVTSNLFSVITTLAKQPGILQDPVLKVLIYEWAEKSGISPLKLEAASNLKDANTQAAQAGQNAAPGAPAAPGGAPMDMNAIMSAAQNLPKQ